MNAGKEVVVDLISCEAVDYSGSAARCLSILATAIHLNEKEIMRWKM